MRNLKGLILTGAALAIFPVMAAAAQEDVGKQEYEEICAVCHGLTGKGDGQFAENLKQAVPSLTTLRKKNGGVFPFIRVYETIDGRVKVRAHGPREMPVWGNSFKAEALKRHGYDTIAAARVVRDRIIAISNYIDQLQEK